MQKTPPLAVTLQTLLAVALLGTQMTFAQNPEVSIESPGTVLLGETETVDVGINNTDTDLIGFDPIIEFIIPALPDDGLDGIFPDAPTLALSIEQASYLGNPVYAQFVGYFDEETGTLINPITQEVVTGAPRSGLYILHYPLSSIAPNQPVPVISVEVRSHALAPIEASTISAKGIFNFGNDPSGQSAPIYGEKNTVSMTPSLLKLNKTVSYAEAETATGPSFPGTWKLIGNVAREASLQEVSFSDDLPNNFQVTSATIIRPANGEINLIDSNQGQSLYASWDNVSGSDTHSQSEILIEVSGYVPEHNYVNKKVLSKKTGENRAENSFTGTFRFERIGIEPEGGLNITGNSNTLVLDTLSLAIQKNSSIVSDTLPYGMSPEDTVEFSLNLQVSDFKEIKQITINNGETTAAGLESQGDILGDALSFDSSYTPTYSASMGGTTASGTFNSDNFSVTANPTGFITGTSRISFDLSQQLMDDGHFDSDGILTGAQLLETPFSTGTTAQIRYHATVDESFDSPESGDDSVDITDWVHNDVDAVGYDLVNQIKVGDESTESLQMQFLNVTHTIERITSVEGIVIDNPTETPYVSPGDQVTFSIRFSIPTGDIEDLILKDFFPYSLFDINDVNGDGSSGDTPWFNPVTKAYPDIGEITYGPSDEYEAAYPAYNAPVFSYSVTNNSVEFDYGSFDSPVISDTDNDAIYDFEFRATLVAGMDDLPDGFKLTSLVQLTHGSTNAGNQDRRAYTGLFFSKSVPVLSKGVVASSNPNATISPAPTSNFENAGSTGVLTNAHAGDLVTFAITLQNTGSDPITHLVLKDVLPPEFVSEQTRIVSLNRADGTPLLSIPAIDTLAGTSDEYALFGEGLSLDSSVSGNYLLGGTSEGAPYGSESLVLIIETPISDTVSPNLQFENTATALLWHDNNIPADGPFSEVSASTTVRTKTIEINKSLTSGLYGDDSSTQAIEVNGESVDRATIGEIVTYDIEIEVPQGTASNAILTDTLPNGLEFIDVSGTKARILSISSPITSTNLSADSNDINSSYITINSNSVSFDFGTLSRPVNGDDSTKTIKVRLYTYLKDEDTNTGGKVLNNIASINWNSGSASSSAKFTIARPNIVIEKLITPVENTDIQGGSTMKVEFTLSNLGDEVGTSAGHDFILDDLVLSEYFDTSSISEDVTPDNFIFSTQTEENGVRVSYSTSSIQAGEEYYLSFTIDIIADILIPLVIENTATAEGSSLPETPPSGIESTETSEDLALTRTAIPSVSKSLLYTSENYTSESPFRLTIGERAVYRLRVDLPEGIIPELTLTDKVPNGMDFVGKNNDPLMAFPGIGYEISGPMGDLVKSLLINLEDTDPSSDSSLTTDGNGIDVKFKFESISNLPDGDNTNDHFFVDLELVALDSASTVGYGSNPTKLKNRARVFCDGLLSGEGYSNNVRAFAVEPRLVIEKQILEPSGDGGDTFTVKITLRNTGGSDAFNVVVDDPIPGIYFKTDQVIIDENIPSGWTVTVAPTPTDPNTNTTVKIESEVGKKFIPGTEQSFSFSVPVKDDIKAPFLITNTATVTRFITLHNDKVHPEGITGRISGGASASADINIANAEINVSLSSTSESYTSESNGLPSLTVGERAHIRVDVDLPDGTIFNPTLVLELPAGLDFVGSNPDSLLTYPGTGFDGFYGTFGEIVSNAFTHMGDPDSSPDQSILTDGSGKDISFHFDSFPNLPDGNPDNNDFYFFIEVVCVDQAGLVGYGNFPNQLSTSVRLDGGSGITGESSSALSFSFVEPLLSIEKSMELLAEIDQIAVNILVQNNGLSTAHNIQIEDVLNPDFFDIETTQATLIPGGFSFTDNQGTIHFDSTGGSILPGEEVLYSFKVNTSATAPLLLTNSAQVTNSSTLNHNVAQPSEIGERNGPQVSDEATLEIPGLEAIMKVKDLNYTGAPLTAGDSIEYTVTINNTSSAVANNVQITAPIPEYTNYIENSLLVNGVSIEGPLSSSIHELGTFNPGESKVISYQVKVDLDLPEEAKTISNSATVSFAERSTIEVSDNDPSGHDSMVDDGIDNTQDPGEDTSDDDPSELHLLQGVTTIRSYLAFEDLKNRGWNDWDHNDILLDVTTHYITDDFDNVSSLIVVYQILARGAAYEAQVNLSIPFNGQGSWKTSYIEIDGTEISSATGNSADIMNTTVYSSTRDALPPYVAGKYNWGASRTEPSDPTPPGKIGIVQLILSSESTNPMGTFSLSPHDTWAHIITTGEDIHRVQYAVGNTQTVLEGPLAGRNLPYVVEFSEGFNWPSETINIYNSHPDYVDYIKSGGTSNQQWWTNIDSEYVWIDSTGNVPGYVPTNPLLLEKKQSTTPIRTDADEASYSWSKNLKGLIFASPVLHDLSNEGQLEVLLGCMDGNVYIFDAEGNNFPGWPQMTAPGLRTSPSVGDIDNDGHLDIVIGATDGKVYAWNLYGTLKEGFPIDLGSPIKSVCNLTNIDGDPAREIIIHSGDSKLHVLNGSGAAVEGWPQELGGVEDNYDSWILGSSPTIVDLGSNGSLQIAVGSTANKIHMFNADGSTVEGWPAETGDWVYPTITQANLVGDHAPEIIAGSGDKKLYAWTEDGEVLPGFPVTLDGGIIGSVAAADLDEDGETDLVATTLAGSVYAISAEGQILDGWPQKTNASIVSSPIIIDADADGKLDVIASSRDNWLYTWNADGTPIPALTLKSNDWIESTPTAGDIDGDGKIELVYASYDTSIRVLDLTSAANPKTLAWPSLIIDRSNSTIDLDQDNIPDIVEIDQFGHMYYSGIDDSDHDGVNNLDEWMAGTDASDAQDSLILEISPTSDNSSCVLKWEGRSNRSYRIYTTNGLKGSDLNWVLADGESTQYTNINQTMECIVNAGTDGTPKFFRLVVSIGNQSE